MDARPARRSLGAKGLTPLLDTLFLLLFTLLATSEPARTEALEMVRIQLPRVEAEASGAGDAAALLLEVDADSRIRLEGSGPVTSLEELDAALAAARGGRSPEEVPVRILGDREARHGVAVQLLQHLRLLGFVSIELVAAGGDEEDFLPRLGEGPLR